MKKIVGFVLCFFFLFTQVAFAQEITVTERTEGNRYGIPSRFPLNETTKSGAMTVPYVDEKEHVYDFAELFSLQDVAIIQKKIRDLVDEVHFNIVVVTTDNLSGTAMDYADNFYDYNNFGIDGVLLLIAMNTREVYISTAGNAFGIISNTRSQYIIEKITPQLTIGNYTQGVMGFLNEVQLYHSLGKDPSVGNYEVLPNGKIVFYKNLPLLPILLFSFLASVLVTFLVVKRYKKIVLAKNANQYINEENLVIRNDVDQYINTVTTRIYVGNSSSSSGGGGDSHSGSSGASHGGAGGHF